MRGRWFTQRKPLRGRSRSRFWKAGLQMPAFGNCIGRATNTRALILSFWSFPTSTSDSLPREENKNAEQDGKEAIGESP